MAGDLRLTNLLGRHQLKYGLQASRLSGSASTVALFARDSVRLSEGVLLDAGVRWERDQLAESLHLLPRLGLSWDWSGRGTSRAFAAWGRTAGPTSLAEGGAGGMATSPGVADQAAAGVESQVFRDLAAGLVYEHASLELRHSDAVTLFLRKPFAESYLLSASYTLSRLRGSSAPDHAPNAFKLDLAYLYELDARTSISVGAVARLFDLATALLGEIDLRLVGTRKLGKDLGGSLTLDVFNLTNAQVPVPYAFAGQANRQLPFSLRGGAALSF